MIQAQYRQLGGTVGYIEQWGQGQPVLCVHTAGQSGVQWRHVAPVLASHGYRVIVPDLPGHGRSEGPSQGPVRDLADYGVWCERLLEELNVERPFVVGCSIGGKIALDLAIRMGSKLQGVVAMAADAGLPQKEGAAMARGLERDLSDAASPCRTDRTFFGTLAVVGRSVPPAQAHQIALMHRREDPEVSNSDLIGWASFDRWNDLGAVACPVHLVAGEDDLWLDLERVKRTAQAIPNARYTVLKGIGHYPMEELDDAGEQIRRWFDGLKGGCHV